MLLETEWVLRGVYGFPGKTVASALRAFAAFPGVSVESPDQLAEPLDRAEKGMDFADALHLSAAMRFEALLTFDRRLVELAEDAPIG